MTGPDQRPVWRSPLAATIAAAVLLLVAVSAWLLTDPDTSRSDALKTGGLAAGSIVALYALWLNDRRRRVEEGRQAVERARHDLELRRAAQDRDRIAEERFARSVELLGSQADQVRVGALHALAGLAAGREDYRQTVIDVLCSYLRRPFNHPDFEQAHGGSRNWPDDERDDAAREQQVRQTAQRLIRELLPEASERDAPAYDLDLTGARLDGLDLSNRVVGRIGMQQTVLLHATRLVGARVRGRCHFAGAEAFGPVEAGGAVFEDRAVLNGFVAHLPVDLEATFHGEVVIADATFHDTFTVSRASFLSSLDLRHTRFAGRYTDLGMQRPPAVVSLYNTIVNPAHETRLPPGWKLESLPDGSARIRSQSS